MIPVTTTSARSNLVIALSTAFAAAVVTGACGSDEPEFRGPFDGDTYVAVMAELADLQRFPPSGPNEAVRTARADSARRVILERHGVTADELLEFAETAGARPDLMLELSEQIVALSDSLAQRRTGAGRAADSATAGDLGREPDRQPVPAPVADSVSAPATETADSAPPARLDSRSLRERAGQLRGRSDSVREPAP